MPSVSKAQRHFMGMCQHSDHPPSNCPDMSEKQYHEFSSTKEKGLPMHVSKKAEENLRNGFRRK